jgi:hypothetical protein
VDWQENYGVRVRAFLTPTTSADYTFWISGDDQCELWLSTDATPEKRVRIARTPSWTAPLLWTKFPEQRSVPVTLAAGQRYYIEALMKEGTGGDSLAVAWADSPTGTPAVIGGGNLAPFEVPPTVPLGLLVEAGQAIRRYAPNLKIDLSAQTLDLASPSRGATVAWSQVGGAASLIRTPGNANTEVDLPAVGTYTFRATASNSSGTVTDDVVVTILPKLAPDAGSALTEFWFGIDGRAVSNLTSSSDYPGNPHAHRTVTSLTAVDQIAEQFGDRTRGFLLVPVTGSYRFFLAANETAEFFLSTDQTTANLRSLATVSVTQITAGQLTSLGQGTDPVELVAGRRYAFQVLRKDDWGTDSCSLMWQRPGSGYAEEITTEYLAPPSDGPAATLASQALALDSDFVIHAGRDHILYLPRQSLSLSAYEQRRYGSDVPVRTWSQVSGPGGVVFSSPGTAQTSVTLPRAGVYVLRYKVQTARNTTIDDVRIEVRSALSASAGAFTRQVWWRRNFASLDAFRADPSFPRFPDIVDNISELRQNADWSDLYATRVTGLLRVPPGPETAVDYRFAVSGDEAVEFSISTGPGAEGLRRVAFSTRPSGRDNIRNEASQISSPISLRPGGSYFVEMLHRETWSSDYFAVSWSRSGDNRFSVIDGSFAEPTANVQAFSGAVNAYANAGRGRTYWWPHQKTRLSGATSGIGIRGRPRWCHGGKWQVRRQRSARLPNSPLR